jgi:hypothetical protein
MKLYEQRNYNKTQNLTAITAILLAATLVVSGTFASTMTKTAFAASNKNGNTVTAQKAQNEGSASGFDTSLDEGAQNVICTHPGENAICT